MLILHKILPLLVLPPGLCLLLIIAGQALHRTLLIRIGAGLLFVLSVPLFSDSMMRVVEWPYRRIPVSGVRSADAIVVLGGMISHTKGAPLGEWNGAADRFDGGLDIYRAGKAPLLVFSYGEQSNDSPPVSEGQLLERRAVLVGIPKKAIRVTGFVGNTAAEAFEVSRLLGCDRGHPRKIILVTSAFHMKRATMLFSRTGFLVEPYPVDFRASQSDPTNTLSYIPDPEKLDLSALAMREAIGIGYYTAKASLENAGFLRRP